MNQNECRLPTEDDAVRQYVAGLLPEAEAEEFEAHLFECDACAEEVQQALEIRAALNEAPAVEGRRPRRPLLRAAAPHAKYSLLAAAAVAAVVAVGLWQVRVAREPFSPPPLRSSSTFEIAASGHLNGSTFSATWKPVPGARSYRVQVFDSVGEPVSWTETSSTRLSASVAPHNEPRFWKVQALDDDRVVIGSSALIKIESR